MKANFVCSLGTLWLAASISSSSPADAQERSPFGAQVRELGGATLKSESWLGVEDYPSKAFMNEIQGRVIFSFDITAEGRAQNCVVETSSGHPILDAVPCRLLERRARFVPTSENGSPRATKGMMSADFWLPD